MRSTSVVLALLFAAAIACSQPGLTMRERAVVEQTLNDNVKSWVRAFNNRDRDSLSAMYLQTSDLTVIWTDGRVSRGWEEEEMAQTSMFNSTERMNFVVQNPQVQVLTPLVALVTFGHSLDVVRLGGRREMVRPGRGTLVWMRDAEENPWRIHMAHLSVSPGSTN